jgi:hypothetical protein
MERLLLEVPKALIVREPFCTEHRSVTTGEQFSLASGQHLTIETESSLGASISIRDADGCRSAGTETENVFISTQEIGDYCLLL